MTHEARSGSEREERLHEAIAAYLEASRDGQAPERSEFVARYPEVVDELKAFFADHDKMNRLVEPLRAVAAEAGMTAGEVAEAATVGGGSEGGAGEAGSGAGRASVGGRRFGDYELIEELGRGGMGVVYKARQGRLKRVVALKMIRAGQWASEDDVRRFQTEAEAAANLRHANIVAIHEVGEHEGQHYFSMDYVEGKSLAEMVRESPLSAKQAARYVAIIADAIQFAHEKGTLHRDLKPSNVLIDAGDQPRVTDFGLAKRNEGGASMTGTGEVLGTPSYMPPEQAAGEAGRVGPGSDVYSMGAMLYELVTGRPPFRAAMPLDTLLQVLESEPVRPRLLNPKVPRDIETMCLKCLEKNPRRRYGSAGELAEDLRRFLRGEPIRARRVTPVGRAWRWCKRNPAVACLSAGLVAAVVGGLAGMASQWTRAQVEAEQHQRTRQVAAMAAEDKTFYFQLENGLTVLLRPIEGAGRTALVVLYGVGGDHDPRGESGLAHMTEHAYVTAAAGRAGARTVEEYLRRYPDGWNAQTGDRYTVFATEFPAERLGEELADAAARMSDLHVTQGDVERERPRVLAEVGNMFAAVPMLAGRNIAREMIRPTAHGGRRGGAPEQVERLTAERVQAWWQRYYKPRNAIVVLAGKMDVVGAREAVAGSFAELAAGEVAPAAGSGGKPELGRTQRQAVTPNQREARSEVCVAYATPEPADELFPAFLVLAARLQNGAASFPSGGASPMDFPVIYAPVDDPGLLYVRATVKDGETAEETVGRLEGTVAQIVTKELQGEDALVTVNTFAFLLGTQPLADAVLGQNVYGTAFRIGRRAQLGINAGKLAKAIQSVGADELRRAGEEYFSAKRQATAVVTVK